MTENKRIFLSGALIAGLLLLIPPYLSFIGVSFDLGEEGVVLSPEVEVSSSKQNQNSFQENKMEGGGSSK